MSHGTQLARQHLMERRRAQHAMRSMTDDHDWASSTAMVCQLLRMLARRQAQDLAAAAASDDGTVTGVRRRWILVDRPADSPISWLLITELDSDPDDMIDTMWLTAEGDGRYDRAVDLSNGRAYSLRAVVIRTQVSVTDGQSAHIALTAPPGGRDWATDIAPDADYTQLDAFARYGGADVR